MKTAFLNFKGNLSFHLLKESGIDHFAGQWWNRSVEPFFRLMAKMLQQKNKLIFKMTLRKYLAVICLIVSGACNQSATNGSESDATQTVQENTNAGEEMKTMIPESGCYAGTIGKDSMFIKIEVFPNVVTGKLEYNFYEKDDNIGNIDGEMHGDTLIANYTFNSEGSNSVRQVAFLVQNEILKEGYAPMENKQGKMVFTDLSQLKFEGPGLSKTPCGEK